MRKSRESILCLVIFPVRTLFKANKSNIVYIKNKTHTHMVVKYRPLHVSHIEDLRRLKLNYGEEYVAQFWILIQANGGSSKNSKRN